MTWPEVFRWLALVAGTAASIAGLAWTLGRIFRPWMRDAAQDAADGLYERLKNNDFRHVEDRIDSTVAMIDRGLRDVGDRIERVEARHREAAAEMEARLRGDAVAMEARIGERIDRMGGRMEAMEARLLAAFRRRPDTDRDPSSPADLR